MEHIQGGSVASQIRGLDEPLGDAIAARYARQMVEALAFMHHRGIIHRDLKCDNILIQNGVLKITDFGTAKSVGTSTHSAQTIVGTPYFMAPETLSMAFSDGSGGPQGYGSAVDVWALGITVGEMINRGEPPWPQLSNLPSAFMYIGDAKAGNLPIVPPNGCAEFIRMCCVRDPKQRPTAKYLLQHSSWIQNAGLPPGLDLPDITAEQV